MNSYLLLTNLKHPSEVLSHLSASMVDVAKVSETPPDSVRIDPGERNQLSNDNDRNRMIDLIRQGLTDCGEPDPQMGLFTD
jgi:hypothetical protein